MGLGPQELGSQLPRPQEHVGGGGVLRKKRDWWLPLALTRPTLIFPKVYRFG